MQDFSFYKAMSFAHKKTGYSPFLLIYFNFLSSFKLTHRDKFILSLGFKFFTGK